MVYYALLYFKQNEKGKHVDSTFPLLDFIKDNHISKFYALKLLAKRKHRSAKFRLNLLQVCVELQLIITTFEKCCGKPSKIFYINNRFFFRNLSQVLPPHAEVSPERCQGLLPDVDPLWQLFINAYTQRSNFRREGRRTEGGGG